MTLKYNTKQRYKTIQGLRSFKDTLPLKAKRILNKKGHIFTTTLDNWKYIVGDENFKICFPKSYKSSNKLKGSCLNIMVKRGSEVELEYSKKNIIKKINTFFGFKVVETINLRTFEDLSEKNIKNKLPDASKSKHIKKIRNIKNDKIKKSLLELNKLFRTK